MIYVVDPARELVWETGRNKITEVVALLKDTAYRFGITYAGTRDADTFRIMNPTWARYKMVRTLEEFISEGAGKGEQKSA